MNHVTKSHEYINLNPIFRHQLIGMDGNYLVYDYYQISSITADLQDVLKSTIHIMSCEYGNNDFKSVCVIITIITG